LTKVKPLNVEVDMGIEEHDQEGRVIAAEFDNYFLVTVYVPNSGSELKRLDYRTTWDSAFLKYLQNLEKTKPVIVCGDLNVAHKEIDLARPKANYNKHAGFTQKEIDGIDAYTNNGFVDSFRMMNPEEVKYSWWSYRGGARDRNVGWRIDYFLVSESIKDQIKKADILNDIKGSDHCPVLIELEK
jgi:exodeoxyribonuclease-3